MVSVTHATPATGSNNSNRELSVVAWNEEHTLTGDANASLAFDSSGASFDRSDAINGLAYLTGVKRLDVLNRTGLYDHSAEMLEAIQAGVDNSRAVYFPAGLWTYAGAANGGTRIEPTLADGDSVTIFGDGPGQTVIRESDGGNVGFSTDLIVYINVPDAVTVKNVIIHGLTIDKNGASNGAEPSAYAWQQSHCLRISTGTTSGLIQNLVVENVETLDKTGGGIVLAGGFITSARIINCHARDFGGLVSERGDLENQATINNLVVESCSGQYVQSEPNATTASGRTPVTTFRNCVYDTTELEGFTADVTAQRVVLENCIANTKLLLRDMQAIIRGGRYQVNATDYWRRLALGSAMYGGTMVNRYNSGANTIDAFYPRNETTLGGFYFTFYGTTFEPGTGASGTTTGSCIDNVTTYDGTQPYLIRFVDCTFSPLYQRTINAYRNGIYEFVRCKFGGWSTTAGIATINVGGTTTTYGQVTLEDCDFSACTATYNFYFNNSNALWKLTMRGVHDYSAMKMTWTGSNPETKCRFVGVIQHTGIPTGAAVIGMKVQLPNAAYGTASEYYCTAGSASAATFRMSEQNCIKKDTTANRPTPSASDIGLQYLDTTLDADGRLVIWNGTAFFDATGA